MLARPSRLTVTGAPAARLSRSLGPVALLDATLWSRLLPLCGGLAGLTSFGCVCVSHQNLYPPRVPRGRSPVGPSTSELVIRLVRTVRPLLGPPLLTKSLPPPNSLVGCGVVAVMPSYFTGSTGFHLCLLGVDFVRCHRATRVRFALTKGRALLALRSPRHASRRSGLQS